MAESPSDVTITAHARAALKRRELPEELILEVVRSPEQIRPDRPGRQVFQSRISLPEWDKLYLVRVFVDVDREPAEIVTAYRTSKVARYWEQST